MKKRRFKIGLMLCLLIFIAPNIFAGGPWVQKKNEGILLFNLNPVIYRTMSSSIGDGISLPRRISDISQQTYFEYGLSNSFTLLASLELKYEGSSKKLFTPNNFINPIVNGKIFGIGNSMLGVKYGILKNKFLLSLSYSTEFPAFGKNDAEGLRTGIPSWGFVPGIQFGQGFEKGVYYYVEGYFVARDKWSHEWRANAEVGYKFKKPLTMAVYFSSKQSLKNKAVIDNSSYQQTGLFLNNQAFIAWSFKFIYELNDKMGITTALSGGFKTELIARTPVISGGFYWKLK